jgi:hypothetical protein
MSGFFKDVWRSATTPERPNVMIVGHARHGKDTVAEYLRDRWAFNFTSSSWIIAEELAFEALSDSEGYRTVEECYRDRANHRSKWYDMVEAYCRDDPTAFGRLVYSQSEIYCGLRSRREFHALRNANVFDVSIWVDRSDHLGPEPRSSMTLEPWMADYFIDNNESLENLYKRVDDLMETILGK